MTQNDKPAESPSSGTPVAQSTGQTNDTKSKSGGFVYKLTRFVLVCLYIGFLVALVLAALAGVEYYAYLQIKKSTLGEAYKGRSLDQARLSSQKVAPQYGYEPTPGFAAVRNTRWGNSAEYINEACFKDFEEVPMEKPANEFRVIMTGGSVVYGRGPVPPADKVADYYEVTFRWTIPHILEMLLNADPAVREKVGGKKIRVINAGVPGYVIQNDLTRYLGKLRLYKPDLIVSLDGANEVHTVARPLRDWNYFSEGPYWEVVSEVMDMGRRGLANYLTLWLKRNTYFFTWLAMRRGEGPGTLMEDRGFASHPQDPTPEMMECLRNNIGQVADVEAIYHKVLETDRVPHVLALQPMFRNCTKKRSPMEQSIEKITGMQKIGFYDAKDTYDALVKQVKKRCAEEGIEVIDLTGIFTPVTEWVWTDWCHLTNGANYIIARALWYNVKKQAFGLTVPSEGPFDGPLDSYFRDYAKEAKVLVNGQFTDRGLHILKGYPGPELLAVPAAEQTKAPGVALDLESEVPVSRLRIVWGDKESVPTHWRIDISADGTNWTPWITESAITTDSYDQWPGFEYYAPSDATARYVRYVQTDEDQAREIKLRQISLFR
jgi:hypothetical protein